MARTEKQSQDALRSAIKRYSENLRISQTELASRANVSQPLISYFLSGKMNLSEQSRNRVRVALSELIQDRAAAIGFRPISRSTQLAVGA